MGFTVLNYTFKNTDSFKERCNETCCWNHFRGLSWPARDFAFLGHDNLFSQTYMTCKSSYMLSWSLSHSLSVYRQGAFEQISMAHIILLLLTYLIFSTHAQSVKWEGHNPIKKESTQKSPLCSSIDIAILQLSRQP